VANGKSLIQLRPKHTSGAEHRPDGLVRPGFQGEVPRYSAASHAVSAVPALHPPRPDQERARGAHPSAGPHRSQIFPEVFKKSSQFFSLKSTRSKVVGTLARRLSAAVPFSTIMHE
jgi:hypothetical protein